MIDTRLAKTAILLVVRGSNVLRHTLNKTSSDGKI